MLAAAASPKPLDQAGLPVRPLDTLDALRAFESFFTAMTGTWNSERTYHYLCVPPGAPTREESQTTFDVRRLFSQEVEAVLASNEGEMAMVETGSAQGFNVSFMTKMGSRDELVRSSTNVAFVPEMYEGLGVLKGTYYRDLGYEEAAPVRASFVFNAAKMCLSMTTFYTRVVSVDQIELANDNLRLRKIVNYRRPAYGVPLTDVVLVGYGVESKGDSRRLVE